MITNNCCCQSLYMTIVVEFKISTNLNMKKFRRCRQLDDFSGPVSWCIQSEITKNIFFWNGTRVGSLWVNLRSQDTPSKRWEIHVDKVRVGDMILRIYYRGGRWYCGIFRGKQHPMMMRIKSQCCMVGDWYSILVVNPWLFIPFFSRISFEPLMIFTWL